ncbi:MAG: SDR family oxidoreductase [Planctomycetes bacterium]|nr:SDR family oxidoreductase [Planctomycetota bacterium]
MSSISTSPLSNRPITNSLHWPSGPTALRLAKDGATVVVVDIDEDGGRETVGRIEEEGGRAAFVRADVTNPDDVRAMVAFAEETFGGLDILHNNAGIFSVQPRFPDGEPDHWLPMLEVNLRGVVLGTYYGIQAMRRRGGGAIVNTASLAGLAGYAGNPVYCASKGGVVLFTASLATLKDELNIRVNCVCPGVVDTPMVDRLREGMPAALKEAVRRGQGFALAAEEVADAVVELIEDDSLAPDEAKRVSSEGVHQPQ